MKKTKGLKVIKDQIRLIIVVMVTVSLILMGIISCVLNFVTLKRTLETNMLETVNIAAEHIHFNLSSISNSIDVIGSIARLSSETVSTEEKQTLLDGYAKHYNWEIIHLMDKEGYCINTSLYIGDKEYFKEALKGNITFDEPSYDDETDKVVVKVAAPLWKDGLIDTEIAGVLLAIIDAHTFTETVANIKVSENGASYMINSNGDTIAHAEQELEKQAEDLPLLQTRLVN